jgi:transcriptional regulator with XRE-family HTH domain
MEVLAARLKWLRESKRLGQKEVASEIGISLNGLQKFEYNESNPKIDTLIKVARYFEVSTDFLLGLNDETDELSKLRKNFVKYKDKLDRFEGNRHSISAKLYNVREDQYRYSDISDKYNEEHYVLLDKQIKELQEQLAYYDHNYYENKMILDKFIIDYLLELYRIPFSKPEEDVNVKDLLPLTITLEEYGDKNYKGKLKSLSGHEIGLLFMIQSPNKEENEKEARDKVEEYSSFFRVKH